MRWCYLLPLLAACGLAAQPVEKLKDPNEVLRVQPFRQWAPKASQARAFFVAPKGFARELPGAEPQTCSIPLITIKPGEGDRGMVITVPKGGSMPQAKMPAPPCENWPMK